MGALHREASSDARPDWSAIRAWADASGVSDELRRCLHEPDFEFHHLSIWNDEISMSEICRTMLLKVSRNVCFVGLGERLKRRRWSQRSAPVRSRTDRLRIGRRAGGHADCTRAAAEAGLCRLGVRRGFGARELPLEFLRRRRGSPSRKIRFQKSKSVAKKRGVNRGGAL